MRGESKREDAFVNGAEWYEENGVELLKRGERDVAGRREADGEAADEGGGGVLQGADRHRRASEHPPPPGGGAAGGDPLPARARELGCDPAGGAGGRARGADRRQLHRQRGGGVPDRDGDQVHDGDAGRRGAVTGLRRGGGALLPRDPRVERDRARGGESWRPFWATAGAGDSRPRAGARSRAMWSWWGRAFIRTRCSRSGPAWRWTTGSFAIRTWRPRSRGSLRPETCARMTAPYTPGGCGSSTGTWRFSRDSTWPAGCWATRSHTGWSVLLQRPGGLDEPGVRGAGAALGRDRLAGRP